MFRQIFEHSAQFNILFDPFMMLCVWGFCFLISYFGKWIVLQHFCITILLFVLPFDIMLMSRRTAMKNWRRKKSKIMRTKFLHTHRNYFISFQALTIFAVNKHLRLVAENLFSFIFDCFASFLKFLNFCLFCWTHNFTPKVWES